VCGLRTHTNPQILRRYILRLWTTANKENSGLGWLGVRRWTTDCDPWRAVRGRGEALVEPAWFTCNAPPRCSAREGVAGGKTTANWRKERMGPVGGRRPVPCVLWWSGPGQRDRPRDGGCEREDHSEFGKNELCGFHLGITLEGSRRRACCAKAGLGTTVSRPGRALEREGYSEARGGNGPGTGARAGDCFVARNDVLKYGCPGPDLLYLSASSRKGPPGAAEQLADRFQGVKQPGGGSRTPPYRLEKNFRFNSPQIAENRLKSLFRGCGGELDLGMYGNGRILDIRYWILEIRDWRLEIIARCPILLRVRRGPGRRPTPESRCCRAAAGRRRGERWRAIPERRGS
jgi:hypothetical protein